MKPRVLIVSGVVPALDRGGGCLALYRHFVQRSDFDFAVASMYPSGKPTGCREFWIRRFFVSFIFRVVCGRRLAENINFLLAGRLLPVGLYEFAREWHPTVIFGVVDDFHAPIAATLARRLGVPLVVNFQDLFACSRFVARVQAPYRWLQPRLLERYRRIQSQATGVLYTSPGMRAWFGEEANGDILYPIGGGHSTLAIRESQGAKPQKLIYAGNCYGPYGEMILSLAYSMENHPRWKLEIYSMGNDWPKTKLEHFEARGVYRGYLPFSELSSQIAQADALLTVMSFHPDDQVFVKTSFTTKILDYLPLEKPILAWVPAYSTVAQFAATTRAALLVTDADPKSVIESLDRLREGSPERTDLVKAAKVAAKGTFATDRIHDVLRQMLKSVSFPPVRNVASQ